MGRFRTIPPTDDRGATMLPNDPQYDMFSHNNNPEKISRLALDPEQKKDLYLWGEQTNPPVQQTNPLVPYKYQEDVILKEIAAYIDTTYKGHYVGEDNVQSLDLILATGHATGFNVGNMLKYGSRYGKKRGYNRDDLLKVIHYAIFELFNHSKNHMGDDD